jgi:RHS repeat-associated protein
MPVPGIGWYVYVLGFALALASPATAAADAVPPTETTDPMHARYYSPNLGRFVSVDPVGGTVGSSQSWNRYSYVRNNPVIMIDPNGEAGRFFINDTTVGQEFDKQGLAAAVEKDFADTGAEATVEFGKPSLIDRAVAFFKGDKIETVNLKNMPRKMDPDSKQGLGYHSKVDGNVVHASLAAQDDPSTPGNERTNSLAGAISHEIGHALGLDDNSNELDVGVTDIMTSPVSPDAQAMDNEFNRADADHIERVLE